MMKDIIVKRRKELGLTQQHLAEKLNISDKVISKWETGKSLPDTSMLIPLARALQISVNELLGANETMTEIDNTTDRNAGVLYKNCCIATMAMQLVTTVLIIAGRVILNKINYYGGDLTYGIVYILITIGVICEITAATFYLIRRNNLLTKYPRHTHLDKKYITIMLFSTYALVLSIIFTFVLLHGLSTTEQLITLIISAVIAALPFATLFAINKKRKG